MTSRIPPPPSSSSRLPTPSQKVAQSRSIKRNLSGDIPASPEKKSRLYQSGNSSRNSSIESLNEKSMPCPTRRPPPRAAASVGKLRRSVSMASINVQNKSSMMSRSGNLRQKLGASNQNLLGRSSNVTAATLSKRNTLYKPAAAPPRQPVSNITNQVRGTSRDEAKTPAVTTKGKSKRPPWDLKGRLQDMEQMLKENCAKISDYDSRMASLEAEKNSLCVNLEQTKSYSASAQDEINELKKLLSNEKDERMEEKKKYEVRIEELELKKSSLERKLQSLETDFEVKLEEIAGLKSSVAQLVSFKAGIEAEFSSTKLLLEAKTKRVDELEKIAEDQANAMREMTEKIMNGEAVRRRLHNLVQELKGNIRVFCRVRPLLSEEVENNGGLDLIPHINIIDEKSLELIKNGNLDGSSMSGLKNRNNNYDFSFDRVFGPKDSQAVVFEEVSMLAQSVLDGYNVCVFAYGQTGSGKTFTMEGIYNNPDLEGIIPRTVSHIFQSMEDLEGKGWKYEMSASFLEIYNETIRDLLANPKEIKSNNYEIKLMDGKKPDTYVTNLKVVPVEKASEIHRLLAVAQNHRAVASTNMNERSSRSHSVFQLRLQGKNLKTEEACEGTLSLVDLAGSERLKESGSEGARLTETQNINRSLANLGNVIMAIAQKQSHVPYRNSKLTHLLQNSLGGNSKTLMLVNVSPLDACFNETLNSLRFATKVNQCHIGTAVKQVRK